MKIICIILFGILLSSLAWDMAIRTYVNYYAF